MKSFYIFCLLLLVVSTAQSQEAIRIVVLPVDTEGGAWVSDDDDRMEHYRRTMRFINNELVKHGFEVVNPAAKELLIQEYDRMAARIEENSKLASLELCRRYETDAAYIVWLDVHVRRTRDGYCKVKVRVEGEGYDTASRDLGAGLLEEFHLVRRNCQQAVESAERQVGDIVGKKLTAYEPM